MKADLVAPKVPSRREALALGGGAALLALFGPRLPATTAPPHAPAAVSWVVGTPGEYNWQVFRAATWEQALDMARCELCDDDHEEPAEGRYCDCQRCFTDLDVARVESFDGKAEPSPGDWLRAGWGHSCSRCHDECEPNYGYPIGNEAVCDSCLTPDERAIAQETDDGR